MTDTAAKTRKAATPKRIRDGIVGFRVKPAERAALEARAAEAGLALSDFVRSQALNAKPIRARRRPSVDRAELARLAGEIGRLGNNVNQIARNLNRGRPEDDQFIRETVRAVSEMRDAVLIALGIDPTGKKPDDR